MTPPLTPIEAARELERMAASSWADGPEAETLRASASLLRQMSGALEAFVAGDHKNIIHDEDFPDDEPMSALYNDWNFDPFPTYGDFRRAVRLLGARSALTPSQKTGQPDE